MKIHWKFLPNVKLKVTAPPAVALTALLTDVKCVKMEVVSLLMMATHALTGQTLSVRVVKVADVVQHLLTKGVVSIQKKIFVLAAKQIIME